jgi:ATP synthase protein I
VNGVSPDGEEFVHEVRRQAERRQATRGQRVWQGLAQVGTIGWMIALPAVGGAFLGRWVDGRYGAGIFWTLCLLGAGLALGCGAAWRTMNRELHE